MPQGFVAPGGGSGGTTTNVDAGARGLIASILATPTVTGDIRPQAGIIAAGRQWQNPNPEGGANIPIPDPADEAGMLAAGFVDVSAPGAASDSLDTTGPWAGAATAGVSEGLDPATGKRYYVDDSGDWQPDFAGGVFDVKLDTIAGNAPAEDTIPTSVLAETGRDLDDQTLVEFDDYLVRYQHNTPAQPTEHSRIPLTATASGGNVHKFNTAALTLTYVETPRADVDLPPLLLVNPSIVKNDFVHLTTPEGFIYSYAVKDSGGTLVALFVQKIQNAGVSYESTTSSGPDSDPSHFRPGYHIDVESGPSAGGWKTNDTSLAWVQDDATTRLLTEIADFDNTPIWVMSDESYRDGLPFLYDGMHVWSVAEGTRETRIAGNFEQATVDWTINRTYYVHAGDLSLSGAGSATEFLHARFGVDGGVRIETGDPAL